MELEEDLSIDISGRNALNGLPKDVKIYSSEIVEALGELLQIIEEIKNDSEILPQLSSDIKREESMNLWRCSSKRNR